jgi:MYXO-CTERM domain-containing protein
VRTTTTEFVLTVNPIDDPPTIAPIEDQTIDEDTSTFPIDVTIDDIDANATSLSLSATTSNPDLIAPTDIYFSGSGNNRSVQLTPLGDANGSSDVTITVSDGMHTACTSFTLNVTAVDEPPPADPGESPDSGLDTGEMSPDAGPDATTSDAAMDDWETFDAGLYPDPSLPRRNNTPPVRTSKGGCAVTDASPLPSRTPSRSFFLGVLGLIGFALRRCRRQP